MKLKLLSRRHASSGTTCDICAKSLAWNSKRKCARLLATNNDGTQIHQAFDICRGCIQEMLAVSRPLSA